MTHIVHGGRLDAAIEKYGGEKATWQDLSTGINPHAYPLPDIPLEAWHSLPDSAAEQNANNALRRAYQLPDSADISLANGTQMHIQLLPFLFKPQAVAVVGFTYQEHGLCWQRAGHDVYVCDGLESAEATARIIIVVNPNNPDGRVFEPETLIELSRRLAIKNGLLVVDESFADVVENASTLAATGRNGLLVLRSLGKFYGLAGVRFGAAIGDCPLIARLNERIGPWAVSGPTLAIARHALENKKWQNATRKKLTKSHDMLVTLLSENHCTIVGSTLLFVLCAHPKANALYEHLAQEHILVRPFPAHPQWLRIGLPRNKKGFECLNAALGAFNKMIELEENT